MPNAIYQSPESAEKLEMAIRNGLIIRHIDADGICRYILTPRGQAVWIHERMTNNFKPF